MDHTLTEREINNLGFGEIRSLLADLTVTPMARERALQLLPSADWEAVSRDLAETSEGRLLAGKGIFSPPAVEDVHKYINRAVKGGLLSGIELAAIAGFLHAVTRWRNFFKETSRQEEYPRLNSIAGGLALPEQLVRALNDSLDPEGQLLDGASPELQLLRRRQRAVEGKIRDKLDSYLRSPGWNRYLQENLVTIRSGRYVLPVKQEFHTRIPGVVHDQSSSGATWFIEPMPVVELQNQLAFLIRQEEQEIERILRKLTALVAEQSLLLGQNRDLYGRLDLIMARGRLSLSQSAVAPQLASGDRQWQFSLVQARHPLIQEEAVPLTVDLGGSVRGLVITGPNTGGKTVALKTIGLLAAMAQSGLHIPASRETLLPVFGAIRADIGDEQDIVQSLSTFSGHLKNIIGILAEAGSRTLILLDELGAGTDPSEGAALAKAVLAFLTDSGSLTVATTHINELKIFAHQQEGMKNASMEFDRETLSPTYRLLQGVPGQSNALAVAEKLGLPAVVMDQARGFLKQDHAEVESVIASLAEDQRRLSQDSLLASQERARAAVIRQQLEGEQEELRSRRREILSQARREARLIIRRAREVSDRLIRELHRLCAEAKTEALPLAEQARQELQELHREINGPELNDGPNEPGLRVEELVAGRKVKVLSLQQTGEIISCSGQEAVVQVGKMKIHVPLADLRRGEGQETEEGDQIPAAGGGGYSVQKTGAVRTQVDLRGMRLEEALAETEKMLDDALWAGLSQITLIHGQGTGSLKQGLRSYLSGHRLVREHRRGSRPEGGDGVTVVSLIR